MQSNLQLYVIFGCHSECEVIQYYKKLIAKSQANMNKLSWAFNSNQLQTLVQQDSSAHAETGNIAKIFGKQ